MYRLVGDRPRVDLSGVWKYKIDEKDVGKDEGLYKSSTDFSQWKDMAVPSNWYNTEVGDYFGTIWFKTSFSLDKDNAKEFAGKKLFLRFGAVDYYAEVWLNDVFLGFHEGMFNPFEYDVTDIVKMDGENVLVVRDNAPRPNAEYVLTGDPNGSPLSVDYLQHQAVDIDIIKGHMIDCMHKPGSMTKFRGDGNTGGIWDKVTLVAREEVFIEYVKIFTRVVKKKDWLGDQTDKYDGTGLVSVDVRINNTTNKVIETDISMTVTPYNFKEDYVGNRTRKVVLQPGINTCKVVLTVPDAKLWWTWDQGHPSMYTAKFELLNDTLCQNFGIKEVERCEKTSNWYLNGRKVFLRGMRYISSNWMSEANPKMWEEDLNKMLTFHINSIRIGSHVEKDEFYTMCDEMGFLLWQVFPLHYCVSDSDDFIERASEMIIEMGEMLYNHACLGMWSTFKEPEIYCLPDKPNNYFRLCQVLKESLGTVDPTRWIHLGDYREGVMNIMIGCCSSGDTDLNKVTITPDIVEFGAHAIPCLETLKQIIPEDKLWPPHWDTWEYWGFFYNLHFNFGKVQMGNSLEEFIDNSQTYEAKVVKEQIEYLRQRKYDPVGSMYLYYWSDPAPVIGSGLLDYFRRPYKVYDSMKAVYTPVLVSLEWDKDPYVIGRDKIYAPATNFMGKVWVTNDLGLLPDSQIEWEIVGKETNKVEAKNSFKANLPADTAKVVDHIVWTIPPDVRGEHVVKMRVKDNKGNILSENYTDIIVK